VDLLIHYLQIVLLGIVEGVTEFLPISSTGHLLIAEHMLGTQEPDIFNVVIQAGAILAVVFIYWRKITDLVANLDKPGARDYLLKIGLAFAVTSVLILLLTVKLKLKLPESLTPVAWATLIGGFVIFGIEAFAKNLYPHEDVSWFEAVLVGAGQVVAAIFPGASRSGSTIMAGLAAGMKRPSVTQFSFLVGIPTMFAASAYATFKDRKDLHGVGHQLIIDTALGFVVSGIVAFFVVKWLLRFVQSHTFNGFAIYRVILGGVLLIGLYTHAIPDVTDEEPKAGGPAATTLKTPLIAPVPAPVATPTTNTDSAVPATNAAPVVPAVPASTNADSMPTDAKRGTSITEITVSWPSRDAISQPIKNEGTVLTAETINQPIFNVRPATNAAP
jgi:undecaprenyl-diphosphatase